jgi:hypothetical protein
MQISDFYRSLRQIQKKLQIFLSEINDINDVQDGLNKINGSEADAVKQKFASWFSKNKGF